MHERQSPFAYLFSDTDEVLHVAGFRARIQWRWPGSRQWPPVTLGEMLTSGPDFSVCPKAGGGGRVFIKQKLNHTGQEDGLHEKRYILYLTFTTCLWIN